MKLENILDKLGSIEKNSFIKIIDNIISHDPENIREINKIISDSGKGLKSVDIQNISNIFALTSTEFQEHVKCEIQDLQRVQFCLSANPKHKLKLWL